MNPARWRKMTWVLAVWTGLCAVFLVVGVVVVLGKSCEGDLLGAAIAGDATCTSIALQGRGAAAADIGSRRALLWLIGFIILGVVWLLTREKKRLCPHCGEEVPKGLTACAKCGYDFVLSRNPAHPEGQAPVAATPAQAWYDDPERPGHKRWWDGTAWGVRDDEPPPVVAGQAGST
jgi:hypothetical protein